MDGTQPTSIEAELRGRPIRELRAGLVRLGYPVTHCVERGDFISALSEASTSQLRAALGKSGNDEVQGKAELIRQLLSARPEISVSTEESDERLQPGSFVRLFNLQSAPALNMQRAEVICYDATSDRYEVRLEWNGSIKKVRYDNLQMEENTSAPSPAKCKASIPSADGVREKLVEAEVLIPTPPVSLAEVSPSKSSSAEASGLTTAPSPPSSKVSTPSTQGTSNEVAEATVSPSKLPAAEASRLTLDAVLILPNEANICNPGCSIDSEMETFESTTKSVPDKEDAVHQENSNTSSVDIMPSIAENASDKDASEEQSDIDCNDPAAQIEELLIAAVVEDEDPKEPILTPQQADRSPEQIEFPQERVFSDLDVRVEQSVGPLILPTCLPSSQDDACGKATESTCSSPRSAIDPQSMHTDRCLEVLPSVAQPEVVKAAALVFEMKPETSSEVGKTNRKVDTSKKPLRLKVSYDALRHSGENVSISHLCHGLRQLWKAGDLCDVTLLCRGTTFCAHKLVLAAHSKQLKDLVAETSEVHMSWIMYPESLKLLLDFLYEEDPYRDYLPSCSEVNMEVMKLTHQFQLPRLMHRAAAVMAHGLSTRNVVQCLHECDTYQLRDLKDRILCHLAGNKKALAEITHGPDISSHPDVLREILVRVATPKDDGPRKRARVSA